MAHGLAQQSPAPRAAPALSTPIRYDLRSGVPDPSFFPRRQWQAATAGVIRQLPDAALTYGLRLLRTALSDYLGRVRAVVADPGRVVITAGAAHAIVTLHALRERGVQRIAVEDPAWRAIPDSVRQAGLDAVPIAVDEHGLDTGALAEAEVDAVGTASKTLAPGLRLAWLLVPSHLVGEVTAQQGVTRAMPSVLVQAAYASLLERGEIDRHLRRTRRRYGARRNARVGALTSALPQARIAGASAGLHLIGWLPEDWDELAIADAASNRGVAIHTLHRDAAVRAPACPALLLGYGLIAEPAIPRAIAELAHVTGH